MLGKLRQLMTPAARRGADWPNVLAWAEAGSHVFKRSRSGDGFAVEGQLGGDTVAWRLEWGPSQRFYFEGQELRIRCELGLPGDLQMLVMSGALMSRLESETFHTLTDSLKTYADDSAPEEMRWLSMFDRLGPAALGPLRPHFGALAAQPSTVAAWLNGPFGVQLLRDMAGGTIGRNEPFELMVNRGRLTLRTALAEPSPAVLDAWLVVFEAGVQGLPSAIEARSAASRHG
jgi:hypothetical protein